MGQRDPGASRGVGQRDRDPRQLPLLLRLHGYPIHRRRHRLYGQCHPVQAQREAPTAHGYQFDAFTNNNRAIEIRGWRWAVEHNDYEVYSNLGGPDSTFKYNDGEGIMYDTWDNCGIVDSRVVGNRGNTYLSIWRVPMDGLLVQGNEIDNLSLGAGAGNKPGPRREMPVRNVQVIGNKANRIGVGGEPNVGGRIKDNIAPSGKGVIMAPPGMTRENNQGFSEGP